MGFGKFHKNGKTKRKPYSGSKAFDKSCRNHGSCKWCQGNRLHNSKKRKIVD